MIDSEVIVCDYGSYTDSFCLEDASYCENPSICLSGMLDHSTAQEFARQGSAQEAPRAMSSSRSPVRFGNSERRF